MGALAWVVLLACAPVEPGSGAAAAPKATRTPGAALGLNGDLFDRTDARWDLEDDPHPELQWQGRRFLEEAGPDFTVRLPSGSQAQYTRPLRREGRNRWVPVPGWGWDTEVIDDLFQACAGNVLDRTAMPTVPATWECAGSPLEWPEDCADEDGDRFCDPDALHAEPWRHDEWDQKIDEALRQQDDRTSYLDEIVATAALHPGFRLMWVANVVTATDLENLRTVEYLAQRGVQFAGIELGNEVYFNLHREDVDGVAPFDAYHEHVESLVARFRSSTVPGVAAIPISMPVASFGFGEDTGEGDGGPNAAWNADAQALLALDPDAFDAVTVHMYEASTHRPKDCANPFYMYPATAGALEYCTSAGRFREDPESESDGVTLRVKGDGTLGTHDAVVELFEQAWAQLVDGKTVDGDRVEGVLSGPEMLVAEIQAAREAFPDKALFVTEFGVKTGGQQTNNFKNTLVHGAWLLRAFYAARSQADVLLMQAAVGDHLVAAVAPVRNDDDETRLQDGAGMARRVSFWAYAFTQETDPQAFIDQDAPDEVVLPSAGRTIDVLFSNGTSSEAERTLVVPGGDLDSIDQVYVSGRQPYSSAGHAALMSDATAPSMEITAETRTHMSVGGGEEVVVTLPPYSFGYVRITRDDAWDVLEDGVGEPEL